MNWGSLNTAFTASTTCYPVYFQFDAASRSRFLRYISLVFPSGCIEIRVSRAVLTNFLETEMAYHIARWLVVLLLAGCVTDFPAKVSAEELVVGYDLAYPPYEFIDRDGKPAGFNIEIIRCVADVMGLQIRFRPGVWNVIRKELETGEIDILSGMFYSEERDRLVDFSTPHLTVSNAIFVPDGSSIENLDDARGKRIVVFKDDIGHDYIREHQLTDRIITTLDIPETFSFLAEGRGDCAILSRLQGLQYLHDHRITGIRVVGPPIRPKNYCFAVTEGNSYLLAELNEGLSLIFQNGTYNTIYNRWFGERERKTLLRQLLRVALWVLTPLGLLLTVSLYWSWSLNRKVRVRTRDLQAERDYSTGIITNTPAIIIGMAPDGTIRFVNPAAEQATEYRTRELIGKNWETILYPDDLALQVSQWKEMFYRHGSVIDYQMTLATRSGGRRTVGWTSFSRFDERGSLVEIISFGNDLTRRKKAEAALLESERKLSTLVNNLPGMAYRCLNDSERTMEFITLGCRQLTGYNVADFVFGNKVHYMEIIHPDDRVRVQESIRSAVGDDRPFQIEYRIRTVTCEEKWVWEQGVGIRSDSGDMVSIEGFVTDITDRKTAEIRQAELEGQLHQTQKMEAIGTLAGGIAHDFHNILGAIIGYGQIMTMFDLPDDDRFRRRIQQILKAAFRGRDLINQILTFSRKTDGKRQTVWLKSLIDETLGFLRASLPQTICIEHRIVSKTAAVYADPSHVHQILMNLCTNAAQAMQETGGTISVDLDEIHGNIAINDCIGEMGAGPYVRIAVEDTGAGIAPDIQERIFEPFFTTKKPGEGTGMGLAVVHGLVKSNGGRIQMTSRPGKGSLFEVFLPRHDADALSAGQETREALPTGEGHILLVDDEEDLVEVGRDILTAIGYTVEGVTDSLNALNRFREMPSRFDLVITDHIMPGLTGAALAKKLLAIRPDLPVILCTGMGPAISSDDAAALGIREFVLKPLDATLLAELVHKILGTPD